MIGRFQGREHTDIVWAMEMLGLPDIDTRGMCFGYAATAAEYYNDGKLEEFDEAISILLECINDAHNYFIEHAFSKEDFENYLKPRLEDANKLLEQVNKLTILDIFKKISNYHSYQEELSIDNCTTDKTQRGIYNINDLYDFLSSLKNEIIENNPPSTFSGLTFMMVSDVHAVMIAIDLKQIKFEGEGLLFRDINIPKKKEIELQASNIEEQFEMLMRSLELNDASPIENILCSGLIIIPNKDQNFLKECINKWKQSDEYKNINELTLERLTRTNAEGASLLSDAVVSNNLELIKKMFEICPNLQEYDFFPKALCFAILLNKEIADYLLTKDLTNVDINSIVQSKTRGYEFTPLQCAIQLGDNDIIKIILNQNADVNMKHSVPSFFLIDEMNNIEKKEKLTRFFEEKSVEQYHTIRNLTPLHFAVLLGQKETVKLLLDKGSEISNAEISNTDYEISPYELAEAMGYDEITQILNQSAIKEYEIAITDYLAQNITQPSDQQKLAIECLQNIINHQSPQDIITAFRSFQQLNSLDQAYLINNSEYYKAQVTDLYNEYVEAAKKLDFTDIETKVNDLIKEVDEKENSLQSMTDKINEIYQGTTTAQITLSNENLSKAISKFTTLVESNATMSDCKSAEEALKRLLRMNEIIQDFKKPSRFFVAKKPINPSWEKLLDHFYATFINKTDLDHSELNRNLQKCIELCKKNPNVTLSEDAPKELILLETTASNKPK